MINARRLLDDLKRMLKRLEDDLRQRATSVEAMQATLQREYTAAKEAGRAGEAFEAWREGMLTQAGAAWLLSGVFVRFLEDNCLVDEALLSGPEERRGQASERQMRYFQRRPTDSDRDYFYDVFRAVQMLPAVAGLFDESHDPIWVYGISGDAAKELIDFWRRRVPETGELGTISLTRAGIPASSATSTRIYRRRRASAMRCCKPLNSSRSSSLTARWSPPLQSLD